MRSQATRTIAGTAGGSGSTAGAGWTCNRTAAGVYALSFAGARVASATVSPQSYVGVVKSDPPNPAGVVSVAYFSQGWAPLDATFNFNATVWN